MHPGIIRADTWVHANEMISYYPCGFFQYSNPNDGITLFE